MRSRDKGGCAFRRGSMANALPQAIGAQFLYTDRQFVGFCGDKGFAILMDDFLTLAQIRSCHQDRSFQQQHAWHGETRNDGRRISRLWN